MPTLTLRDWLAGSRPVAGALGACSLMLLACSWFVLGPGALGKSSDVGTPAPVRIGDVTSRHPSPGAGHSRPEVRAVATKPRLGSRVAKAPRGTAPTPVPASTPQAHSQAPVAPSPPATPPPASNTSTPQSAPVLPAVTTPTLPAPVGELPKVDVPPVTIQVPSVSVPVLPVTVPAVTVTTPALGLP
jgi:hypothetical protein